MAKIYISKIRRENEIINKIYLGETNGKNTREIQKRK